MKTLCPYLMKVNHIEVANFLRGKYAFNATRKNKILAKISEFTVLHVIINMFKKSIFILTVQFKKELKNRNKIFELLMPSKMTQTVLICYVHCKKGCKFTPTKVAAELPLILVIQFNSFKSNVWLDCFPKNSYSNKFNRKHF